MNNIELHAHLWYKEESKQVLDKVSKKFKDRINLSLIEGCEHNEDILNYARGKFSEVKTVFVENLGNDQVGFIESYKNNSENKDWVFYFHDKKDVQWTNYLIDPLIGQDNLTMVEDLLQNTKIGIIGSLKKMEHLKEEKELASLSKIVSFKKRKKIVKSTHTIVWLRHLQDILASEFNYKSENINLDFFAGTMFMARKNIIKLAHSCVHDSYFERHYSMDGKVEHAMERFYTYVADCLRLETRAI